MTGPAHGILDWLWQEIQEAEESNARLIRVELSPTQWRTLQGEFGVHDGQSPVDYVGGPKPKVFGLPVRVVPGKRAPELVAAS